MFEFCAGCEISPSKQKLCEVSPSKSKLQPDRPVIFAQEPVIEALPSVGQQLPADPGITFDRLAVVGAIAGIERPPPALAVQDSVKLPPALAVQDLPLWQPYLESAVDGEVEVPFHIGVEVAESGLDAASSPITQPREESRTSDKPSEQSVWLFCQDDENPHDEDWVVPETSSAARSARSDTGGGILKWLCQDCVDDGPLASDRSLDDSTTDAVSSVAGGIPNSTNEVPSWWRCDRCCCCITSPAAARQYIAKDSGNMAVLDSGNMAVLR